jgi:hypothetical protein
VSWVSIPAFGRRATVACRIAALALVIVAFEMVISRIDEGAGPDPPDNPHVPGKPSELVAVCEREPEGNVLVVLTATGIEAGERLLESSVAVCRTARTRQDLLMTDRRRVAAAGVLRPQLVNHPVTLVFRDGQGGEASVETTVGELFGDQRATVSRLGPMNLPLDGRPDKYPFDWFSFGGYAQLEFAPGITVPRSIKSDTDDPDPTVLPVALTLLAGPGVGEFDLLAGESERPFGLTLGGQGMSFSLERRALTQRFVIIILLVPVLYALLFALLLGQRHDQATSGLRDLLIGMVAATVALLPLRQVLVPDTVDGLTVVDWWLGATILLFVAVSLWAFPVAIGAVTISQTPPRKTTPPVAVSFAAGAAWTLFLALVAINVPVVLVDQAEYAPAGTIGGIGLLIIAGACLFGAVITGRQLVDDYWDQRGALRRLTPARRALLALAVAVAALVLFVAAWFVVINVSWALGGGSPYG